MNWIGVDWGTSTLRAARLDGAGRVLEERRLPRGILTVAPGGFRALFDDALGDWFARAPRCLIAGMAGSRQGWLEAPYADCPAAPADLARRLAWIEPGRIAIVPGLHCEHGGVPDVMRGEEVQVFGALRLADRSDATLVLPGTHSKWVRAEGGRIVEFATAMTGEFFALLRRHSILARTLPDADDGALDDAAFDAGVAQARRSSGLLESAFSARTLALFERQPLAQRLSYLSGLVIGEELRARAPRAGEGVILVGDAALTLRYARALEAFGVASTPVGASATWRGLHELARGAFA